jgi:hypothetical protein
VEIAYAEVKGPLHTAGERKTKSSRIEVRNLEVTTDIEAGVGHDDAAD